MIENNIIELHRMYEYKDDFVVTLGFALSENNIELVIIKSLMKDNNTLATVIKRTEFLNHATLKENLNNFKVRLSNELSNYKAELEADKTRMFNEFVEELESLKKEHINNTQTIELE